MTPIRLGPYGALWWCLRCGHQQHHEGPWHLTEHVARREAAGHTEICEMQRTHNQPKDNPCQSN
jgi:hypothetical protein